MDDERMTKLEQNVDKILTVVGGLSTDIAVIAMQLPVLTAQVNESAKTLKGENGDRVGLVSEVRNNSKDLEDIKQLLYGDNDCGSKGMKEIVGDLKEKMDGFERLKWAFYLAIAAGIGNIVFTALTK